jgi:hypothetical protein
MNWINGDSIVAKTTVLLNREHSFFTATYQVLVFRSPIVEKTTQNNPKEQFTLITTCGINQYST